LLGESEAGEKRVDAPLFLQGVLAILLMAVYMYAIIACSWARDVHSDVFAMVMEL